MYWWIYEIQQQQQDRVQKDYLNVVNIRQIVQILDENEDKSYKDYCFSDTIFKIDQRGEEVKRKILVTGEYLYEIGNTSNQFKMKIKIYEIQKIEISIKQGALCKIVYKDEHSFMINSFKRTQLIQFICKIALRFNKKIVVVQSDSLVIKPSQKPNSFFQYINDGINNLVPALVDKQDIQQSYLNGKKYGFFFMKIFQVRKLFNLNESYKEYFFVLCDIGLVCLRNPKDNIPKIIIPIIGSKLNINPENSKKENSFMIEFQNKKQEYFYCKSKDELNEWIKEMHKLQEQGIQNRLMIKKDDKN